VWFLAFALYACASPSLAPAPDPFLSFALTLSPYISQKLPLLAIHTGICGFLRLLLAPLRIYTLEQTTPLCGPCALLWVAARERESESHTEMSPGRRYMFNAHPVARSVCARAQPAPDGAFLLFAGIHNKAREKTLSVKFESFFCE
jgi:hypothetical protein